MSACVHELATLLHLSPPASLSPPAPSSYFIAQSQVEYALPSQQLDIDPQLIPLILLAVLTLLTLTLLAASALLLRRLCTRSSIPSASPTGLASTLTSLRREYEQLQSQLTIAQHALQVANKKSKQDEQKAEEERRKLRSESKEEEEKRKAADTRVGALRKEVDILKAENKRLKDERSREKEEAEARKKEEVKRREQVKREEKDARDKRDSYDKRREEEASSVSKQLKAEQHKAAELQASASALDSRVQQLQRELKESQAVAAQVKAAAAPSTPAKSSASEEEKKWAELPAVIAQLRQQNNSLEQQIEHGRQQQQQLSSQQHDQHAAEEAEREEHRRSRSAEKSGALQQLRDQLRVAEEQLAQAQDEKERERKEWSVQLEAKSAERAVLSERVAELELECKFLEERVEELQQQVDEREAEQSRLESERIAEQENRVADLIAQVGVKGLEVVEARQWQDEVRREMEEEFKGRQDAVTRAELRQLLGWPAAPPTRKPVTRPAPLSSVSSASSSAPSSPAPRPSPPSSSVPSSPSHHSVRAALAEADEQLRRAKLAQAESPKHAVSRKQKQRQAKQQREDVMQLIRKKQQLEQRLQEEEKREQRPPVPLFDAPAGKMVGEAEQQATLASAQISQLTVQREALEAQLTALQQSTVPLIVHEETSRSLAETQSQLAAVQQQLEALQQQEQRRQQSAGEEEQQREVEAVAQRERQLADLRGELQAAKQQAEDELSELQARHQRVVQRHEAQTEELKRAAEEHAASQENNKQLAAKLDSLTAELEQTKQQLDTTEQQLRSLEQSTIPATTHDTAVEQLNSQLASLEQQLTDQRAAVADLTTQLHDNENASDHALSTTEAAASTERAALLTRIKQLQTEVTSTSNELRNALAQLADTVSLAIHKETVDALAAAQSELHSLRQQLSNLSSSHHTSLAALAAQTAAEIAQLRAHNASQQQRSTELSDERDSLLCAIKARSEELDALMREQQQLFFLTEQLAERIQAQDTQAARDANAKQQLRAETQQAAEAKEAVLEELYGVLHRHQEFMAATRASCDVAVERAEERVDEVQAELESERRKAAERASELSALQSQQEQSRQAVVDMERAVAGYVDDVRLRQQEVLEARQQLSERQEELTALQQHFVEQKQQADAQHTSGSEADDEHDALNDSLVLLESAIKQSAAHRVQPLDAQVAAGATGATPLRPRRFMFVDVKGASSTPPAEQPATPKQHKRSPSTRSALSPRSNASPSSPRSFSTATSTATATPTTAASASNTTSAASSSAAALVEAQLQVATLQSSLSTLRGELRAKDEALVDSQREAAQAQQAIAKMRRRADGKRDSASLTLSSLQASQTRMEELNSRISAKMQQHYHNRQPSQSNNTSAASDSTADTHVRTQSAPSVAAMAAVSADVSRLLTQLSAEQSRVVEQAQALTALRAQQQTEAVYHSTLVQRLEEAEAGCKRLRSRLQRKTAETDGIKALIEQARVELANVVDESNERAAEVEEWKGRLGELQARVDGWAESEHKAWHASGGDKKESKKEYLKRRWHELTYGGHRHCASCERAAAEKERGEHEPHSASVHGQRTPVKGKHGRKESATASKRADQLQVPGAHHHRSLSDDEEHLHDAHHRQHGQHQRSDSQLSVDGEQLDQTLTHSRDPSHAVSDVTAHEVDHCLHTCKQLVDRLRQHAASGDKSEAEVQADLAALQEQIIQLAAHIKQLKVAQTDRPDLSLVLPTFDQSVGSPISLRSTASADVAQRAADGDRRAQVLEREKLRLQAELRDERRTMSVMEAELAALKEENMARRQDDEEVSSRLQQVKQLVRYQHSRKPSSLTSVGSYSSMASAVSSGYVEEQKEADEQWSVDDHSAELIKQLSQQLAESAREIEQLQLLRREDEERINLAIHELRNSRERVMRDYADTVLLNKQLSDQHTQIEQLTAALQQKDGSIAQLQAEVQQLREQIEAENAAASLSLRDESTADPLTLSRMDNELAQFQQAMEEAQAELKDVKSLVSAQEGQVDKLTRENERLRQRQQQASSASRVASDESLEALVAVGELTKVYRAEKRLREKLQADNELQLATPAVSPSHSRQHSLASSAAGSAASSPRNIAALITPSRPSRELSWWQQQRRRDSAPLGGLSTPAGAVRSALAGAFVTDATGAYSTPNKSRNGGQHSRHESGTAAVAAAEEKVVNAHGLTQ